METRSWGNCCGRMFNCMGQTALLCFSTLCSCSQMLTENHRGTRQREWLLYFLANTDLFLKANVHADSATKTVTEMGKPAEASPYPHVVACFVSGRAFRQQEFRNNDVAVLEKIYHMKKWTKFFNGRKMDSRHICEQCAELSYFLLWNGLRIWHN